MRRLLIITAFMALGVAGTAQAAGTGTLTLTPSTVSAHSGLAVAVSGLSGTGLPNSVELQLQPGFAASAKSVPVLCTASQSTSSSCPAASQIGTGAVGISFFGTPTTVPLNVYLGDATVPGDIASVILSGSLSGATLTVLGRLFVPAGGGLELLLSGFPSAPVNVSSLSISVASTQTVTTTGTKTVTRTVTRFVVKGKGKHRHKVKVKRKVRRKVKTTTKTVYSVITNPSMCAGTWTGTATLTYSSGQDVVPLSAACTP